MHYLIKLIVEGDNAKEALENAEGYAESLVEQGEFDWFDMDGRWGTSKAYKLSGDKGKTLLKEGMQGSRREFDVAMAHIRYMLEHFSDDQIYEENFGSKEEQDQIRSENEDVYYLSRYMFAKADGRGNGVYVYADDWGKIEKEKDLIYIKKDNKVLWVVPVDFHN